MLESYLNIGRSDKKSITSFIKHHKGSMSLYSLLYTCLNVPDSLQTLGKRVDTVETPMILKAFTL